MVEVIFSDRFRKTFSKIIDHLMKEKVIKQIQKIKINPIIGKPMMYERKGTREVYLKPFRFSYSYSANGNSITLLNLYHKKKQ